jgi:hypothetical protein
MDSISTWKLIQGISILVLLASLITFPPLSQDISGDGIPNQPQREPPIEYQLDLVFQKIVLIIITAGIAIYSTNKICNYSKMHL